MGYYKGIKGFEPFYTKVTNNFKKGKRLYTKNNSLYTEELKIGITKHNVYLLRKANKICEDFDNLLRIEKSVMWILEFLTGVSYGILIEIARIREAQKGTRYAVGEIREALKKYKIDDKELACQINKHLESNERRAERNKNFLDEFFSTYGLQKFVKHIKEKYNQSVYEYFNELREEFDTLLNTGRHRNDELLNKFLFNNFDCEVKEAGIDVVSDINKSIEEIKQRRLKKEQDTKMSIEKEKMNKKKELFNTKLDNCMRYMYRILYNKEGEFNCNTLRSIVASMGGRAYFIVVMPESKIQLFCDTTQSNLTQTPIKAKYYKSKDSQEILRDIDKMRKKHPKWIIGTSYIDLTD